MTTIDDRIVQMNFENAQFEKGVQQSTQSIDKLKKSLEFKDAGKGFNDLSNASKGFSLAHINDNLQTLTNRFSALGIIGITALQNLTNAAIDYGKRIVTGFVQPITMGFSEYETQINAIQTTLANTEAKGTTLDDVTAALDELNQYADKTIYNFTEMTKNIGSFTAAGVDLDTSVAAIKGIANLAAVSGSNSQQAATAMYQLSQALSSGTVKLMDWNSVVNAGMGGQVFQDALKETARAHGIAIDTMISQEGSFRETLQEGWLTAEVLTETLSKFTGDLSKEQLVTMGYNEEQIAGILKLGQTANDAATKVKTFSQLKSTLQEAIQSGWTKSWEIIIGDFEEAKAFFTNVSDTLGALIKSSSDARNKLLSDWKALGGRTLLIEGIESAFRGILSIIKPVGEAFREIFPPITAQQLKNLTQIFRDLASGLNVTGETADRIKRIFKGVFSIFAIAKDIIAGVATGLLNMFKSANVSGNGVLEFFARIGDFLTSIRSKWDIVATIVSGFAALQNILYNLGTHIKASNIGEKLASGLVSLQNILYNIGTHVKRFSEILTSEFSVIKEKVIDFFSNLKIDTSGIDGFFSKLKEYFSKLGEIFNISKKAKEEIKSVGDVAFELNPRIKEILSSLSEVLGKYSNAIVEGIKKLDFNSLFNNLFKGIGVGFLGTVLLAMKRFVDSGSNFIKGASDIFKGAAGMFKSVTGILDGVRDSLKAYQAQLKSKVLINIAIAIAILAASLFVISKIDSEKIVASLGALTALFANLSISLAAFSKFGGVGSIGASAALIGLSIAILILAAALKNISEIDEDSLWRGLKAIYAVMAGVLIFSKLMSKNLTQVYSGSSALAIFALALTILVQSVALLGNMKLEVLTNGLIALGVLMSEIAVFMRLADNSKLSIGAGLGLITVTAAILVLGKVVEQLGRLDVSQLKQGLLALGVIFAEVALFMQVTGSGKNLLTASAGMILLSGALYVLVGVVEKLAELEWDELARGLSGLAAALIIVALAMRVMPKNMIISGAGLIVVAVAITILAKALKSLGGLSWEELGRGLLALGISLGILVIALSAMSGTIAGSAALIMAAGALFVISAALAALSIIPLSGLLIALGALAGVFILLGVAGALLTPVVPALIALGAAMLMLGAGVALVGLGLLAFAAGLGALAAVGVAAALTVVKMVEIILGIVPKVIQVMIDSLILFAEGIIKATPIVAKAITGMLTAFLNIIIDTAPKIFKALDVLLKGLLKLIDDNVPIFVNTVVNLLLTLLRTIADKLPEFIDAGFDILIGFLKGIRDNIKEVVTVVTEIVVEFLTAIGDNTQDIIDAGFELMLDFINGLSDSVDKNLQVLLEAVGRLVSNIIDGLVRGLASGAGRVISTLVQMVMDAFNAAKDFLLANSPSKRFIKLGESIPEGLAVGITKLSHLSIKAIEDLVDDTVEASSGIEDMFNIDPTIRPVVDMSNVARAGQLIDDILAEKQLNLIPTVAKSAEIARGISTFSKEKEPVTTSSDGATIHFQQNNYSPVALSRVEIYRQTKNQLNALKGVVGI